MKRKFEGAADGNMIQDIMDWWDDNCNESNFGDDDEYLDFLYTVSNGRNEEAVDDVVDALINDYDWDYKVVERRANSIRSKLARFAQNALRQHDASESCYRCRTESFANRKRSLASRIARLESLISNN